MDSLNNDGQLRFCGADIIRGSQSDIIVSQADYISKIQIPHTFRENFKVGDTMTPLQISDMRSLLGKLAWIAVGTVPVLSCTISAYQGMIAHEPTCLLYTSPSPRD